MASTDERPLGGRAHSTAKIADHPIHPMLIPFPIVCFVGTFVTDILYTQNHDAGWATASHWLLAFGLVMAALAAVAGLTDYLGDERLRRLGDALKHMLANVTAVVLELVNFVLSPEQPRRFIDLPVSTSLGDRRPALALQRLERRRSRFSPRRWSARTRRTCSALRRRRPPSDRRPGRRAPMGSNRPPPCGRSGRRRRSRRRSAC